MGESAKLNARGFGIALSLIAVATILATSDTSGRPWTS